MEFEKWWEENATQRSEGTLNPGVIKEFCREAFFAALEIGREQGWESHANSVWYCEGP